MKFRIGDIVYVDCSNGFNPAEVLLVRGNYYHVRLLGTNSGFGVSGHRLISPERFKSLEVPRSVLRPATIKPPPLH